MFYSADGYSRHAQHALTGAVCSRLCRKVAQSDLPENIKLRGGCLLTVQVPELVSDGVQTQQQ